MSYTNLVLLAILKQSSFMDGSSFVAVVTLKKIIARWQIQGETPHQQGASPIYQEYYSWYVRLAAIQGPLLW